LIHEQLSNVVITGCWIVFMTFTTIRIRSWNMKQEIWINEMYLILSSEFFMTMINSKIWREKELKPG
jgi:hypothetical protein